tara:strand:- start:578 stop:1510 length:933 start_codon:yes stop_codon:yes gene_type:complete
MKLLKYSLLGIIGLLAISLILFGQKDIPLKELKAKYGQEPSRFIKISGMEVHYRDEGMRNDTIPLVLIHGTGASLHTFDDWANQLKSEKRVIRMDLPAYGLTGPHPERDYSINGYVAFIQEFLDALDIQHCIIAGNSLGGNIAWNYALKYPDQVEKLILIDAAGYLSKSNNQPIAFRLAKVPFVKQLFTWVTPRFIVASSVRNVYADENLVTESLIDRYFELSLRPGNRQAFIDRFDVQNDTTAYHRIEQIEAPTLILWGAEDQLIPVEMADRYHEDLPNSTLHIMEKTGHVPMEERPEESLKQVKAFIF